VSLARNFAVCPYSSDSQVLWTSTSSHQLLRVTSGAPAEAAAARARASESWATFQP
jgi:hypothetical protein